MSSRGRGKNPNEDPGVKPIEKIELNVRSPKKGIIIAAILLAVGISFLGYSLFSAISKSGGWTQIETVSATGYTLSGDITLFYDLGASDRSPNAEYKELSVLYSDLCIQSYRIFTAESGIENIYNPYYINRHPNEVLPVDPTLYKAFELIESTNNRFLFAAPFYREYKNMFSFSDDVAAAEVDPYKNGEIAEYFTELSEFTSDSEHVRLELLGNNTVRLKVSERYMAYAKENGIESFIDFYPYLNAFAVDLIAESLAEKGFNYGVVSSRDGFMRATDARETEFSHNLYASCNGNIYNGARYVFKGRNSVVSLRAFPVSEDDRNFYTYASGERRHSYADVNDGLCKNSVDSILCYSRDKSCAEVLLNIMPVFVSDTFDADQLTKLKTEGSYSAYFDGTELIYNEENAVYSHLYSDKNIKFETLYK